MLLQPVVIEQHRLVADVVGRLDLQQFGPLQHPQFGELLAAEQFVDQLLALVRRLVVHEAVVLLRRRQQADDVDVDAAQERLVGAQLRRGDAQLLQLVVDERVDVVVLRHLRELELAAPWAAR